MHVQTANRNEWRVAAELTRLTAISDIRCENPLHDLKKE